MHTHFEKAYTALAIFQAKFVSGTCSCVVRLLHKSFKYIFRGVKSVNSFSRNSSKAYFRWNSIIINIKFQKKTKSKLFNNRKDFVLQLWNFQQSKLFQKHKVFLLQLKSFPVIHLSFSKTKKIDIYNEKFWKIANSLRQKLERFRK